MLDTAASLTAACDELEARAVRYANAHQAFKRERAKALITSTLKTVSERDAAADIAVDELRLENDLAEGMMQAELERVRSLRGILSAFQTIANRQKEEAAFERTGPQYQI
jgi:nucleotidyltransferase/DNA polymerase involved in DNA repair